jgi:phosphopantetheinyl transferase
MHSSELRQQIERIARGFELFECVQCAQAIRQFLREKGITGKQIQLSTGSGRKPYCNIYHEDLKENISQNGRHAAIAVVIDGEEVIFDNIHPQGISRRAWLSKLYSPIKDLGRDFQVRESDV